MFCEKKKLTLKEIVLKYPSPEKENDQSKGSKDEVDPQEERDPSQLKIEGPSQYLEPSPTFEEIAKKYAGDKSLMFKPKPSPPPQPQRLKMQVGMPINFYGYQYRVTKVLRRGRIMLKLLGRIPEGR